MSFDPETIPSQAGRTAVVTGANTGLGYHNALDLARAGAHVVMACRNLERAEEAADRIRAEVPGARLEIIPIDLASLSSVREFAAQLRAGHEQVDVLINNAGVMFTPRKRTVDGFELQLAANHLGHVLLTSLLLDLFPDDPASRVVSLSSLAHLNGRIRFDDLNWERRYDRFGAYAQSKLACLMFAVELDRRLLLAGRKVRSVAAHPGISVTELGRNVMPSWLTPVVRYTIGPFVAHSPADGSLPTLMAAVDPGVEGGEYLGPTGPGETRGEPGRARINRPARDQRACARLWDLSVELTGADFPV